MGVIRAFTCGVVIVTCWVMLLWYLPKIIKLLEEIKKLTE